ncbi:hypothetical protein GCM10020229_67060 [Kitasatospora albolonga]
MAGLAASVEGEQQRGARAEGAGDLGEDRAVLGRGQVDQRVQGDGAAELAVDGRQAAQVALAELGGRVVRRPCADHGARAVRGIDLTGPRARWSSWRPPGTRTRPAEFRERDLRGLPAVDGEFAAPSPFTR